MPKKRMLWTERVMELFPIGNEHGKVPFLLSRLARSLCLFSIFWITLFVLMAIRGTFLTNLVWFVEINTYYCIVGFIVFTFSGLFRRMWDWFFDWSSHILKLSEAEFSRFRDRVERLVNSFFPVLAIALVLFVITALMPMWGQLEANASNVWWGVSIFFITLLYGTIIWVTVSTWIATFLTFRQPLSLKLSRRTTEEFRPMASWSLEVSLLYFVLITVIAVFARVGHPTMEWGSTLFGITMGLLILAGVLAFLLPFYHIHRALVKLKERELQEIHNDAEKLLQELTETLTNEPEGHSEDHMMSNLVKLQILEAKERIATDADDWPIDMTIISALAGLVLVPILVNIITNIFF